MESAGFSGSLRLSIASRIGTIVFALILIGVSAGTFGIVRNNTFLQLAIQNDKVDESSALTNLHNLIYRSLGVAVCIMLLGTVVLIAEIIAIVLMAIFRSLHLALHVVDIIFSVAVAFLYGAAGIASAVYASQWAKPPEPCDKYFLFELFDCDNTSLTATTALSAVFCFIQAIVFGCVVILTTVARKRAFLTVGPSPNVTQNSPLLSNADVSQMYN